MKTFRPEITKGEWYFKLNQTSFGEPHHVAYAEIRCKNLPDSQSFQSEVILANVHNNWNLPYIFEGKKILNNKSEFRIALEDPCFKHTRSALEWLEGMVRILDEKHGEETA